MKKRRYKWRFSKEARMWLCAGRGNGRYIANVHYMAIEGMTFDGGPSDALVVDAASAVEKDRRPGARRWQQVGAFPRTMRVKDMKRACEAMLDINIGGWP